MRVAIITRSQNRSPKVLAEGLQHMLRQENIQADIFFEGIGLLRRLFSLKVKLFEKVHFHFRFRQKIKHYLFDLQLLRRISKYDVIILSECIPNAYWRGYYAIEEFRIKLKKPICLYEVYYLGNSLTHMNSLKKDNHHDINRFDWNFSITDITEIASMPTVDKKWSVIGLSINSINLIPSPREEFCVLVDFIQPGYESYREDQIRVLQELGVKIVFLEGEYSQEAIRNLYKKASIFLIQFPEAFGVSIAECFALGTMVMLPDRYWAMSWRKKKEDNLKDSYYLPDCFIEYSSLADFRKTILEWQTKYDFEKTPFQTFNTFIHNYPQFYTGDSKELVKSLYNLKYSEQ